MSYVLGGALRGLGSGLARIGEMAGQDYFAERRRVAQEKQTRALERFRKELELEFAGPMAEATAASTGLVERARREAAEPFDIASEERAERRGIAAEERAEERKKGESTFQQFDPAKSIFRVKGDTLEEVRPPQGEQQHAQIWGNKPTGVDFKDWLSLTKFWSSRAKEAFGQQLAGGILLEDDARLHAAAAARRAAEFYRMGDVDELQAWERALAEEERQIERLGKAKKAGRLPTTGIMGTGNLDLAEIDEQIKVAFPGRADPMQLDAWLRSRGVNDANVRDQIIDRYMSMTTASSPLTPVSPRGAPSAPLGGMMGPSMPRGGIVGRNLQAAPDQTQPGVAPQQQQPPEIDLLSDDPLNLFAPQQ